MSVDFKMGEDERGSEGCAFFFFLQKKVTMGIKLVSYSLTESSKVILPVIGEVA